MRKIFLLSIIFIGISISPTSTVNAQGVGINPSGNSPNSSAGLDVDFTNKGVLITRVSLLSTTDVTTIPSPATSLLVYNTNATMTGGSGAGFYYWDGTQWKAVGGSSATPCSTAPATPGTINGNPTVCSGGTATFFVTAVSSATSYSWSYSGTGATMSGTGNMLAISFSSSATSGSITVQAVNACGTSSISSAFPVAILTSPTSTFTPSTSTPAWNTSVNFNPTSTPAGQTYLWTFPGGVTSTTSNPSFTWNVAGVDNVSLITSLNGCSSSNTSAIGNNNASSGTFTFTATGTVSKFIVPAGVSSITIDAYGSQGGGNDGLGGEAKGNLAVTGGQSLFIYAGNRSGFNGGGTAGGGCGGGGASDVRTISGNLSSRVIVAGGGGGNGGNCSNIPGGAGGGDTGGTGTNSGSGGGGGGGTQSGGGSGGAGTTPGQPGSLGLGGNGGGGGGGGGYYGGGAGGNHSSFGPSGGGGGSNYLGGVTGTTINSQGVRSGNGQVILTW